MTPIELADALALADAIDRNGGEEPFDLELSIIQTSTATLTIRNLVAQIYDLIDPIPDDAPSLPIGTDKEGK